MSRDTAPHLSHTCPGTERLKAWIDRELDAAGERSVAAHVGTCAACDEETRIMRRIGTALKELDGLVEPPAQLRQRILERIPEREKSPGGQSPAGGLGSWWPAGNPFQLLRWAAAGMAVAVVVVIGIGTLPRARESARSPVYKGGTEPMAANQSVGGVPAGMASEPQSRSEMHYSTKWPMSAVAGGKAAGTTPSTLPPAAGMPGGAPAAEMADGHVKSAARSQIAASPAASTVRPASPSDVNVYTRGAPVDDVKRKVVRTAVLSVRTRAALEGIQKELQQRLKQDEGYVESANLSAPEGGERTATMRLRVPVEKLDDYVTWLSSLGEVRAKTVRGDDVTGAWIDQRAEVRELRKEEARLLKVVNTDRNRDRRSEARWQLLRVRPRIAASEERFALTTKLTALSTVELTLVEPAQARIQGNLWQDTENTARAAAAAFMVALRVPMAVLIWLAVFCPLWLPCLLLYRWATRKARQWQMR